MKLIGPVAPPGVRHIVKLKDGTEVVALMTMGREDVPDGTWIGADGPVEAAEIIGPYLRQVIRVEPR
jgi:hypothetical protein